MGRGRPRLLTEHYLKGARAVCPSTADTVKDITHLITVHLTISGAILNIP